MVGLPVGLVYDHISPFHVVVFGASLSSLGLALMGISLTDQSLWWLMNFGYPMQMVGGSCVSYAAFPFAWALPDDQNFVNSLSNASGALSSTLALLAALLYYKLGISLVVFFFF